MCSLVCGKCIGGLVSDITSFFSTWLSFLVALVYYPDAAAFCAPRLHLEITTLCTFSVSLLDDEKDKRKKGRSTAALLYMSCTVRCIVLQSPNNFFSIKLCHTLSKCQLENRWNIVTCFTFQKFTFLIAKSVGCSNKIQFLLTCTVLYPCYANMLRYRVSISLLISIRLNALAISTQS